MDERESKTVYFGAGCFWNSELVYHDKEGVVDTEVGWCKIPVDQKSDEETRIEVVRVRYDPDQVKLNSLIEIFWETHNPESKSNENKRYVERSVLVYDNEYQKELMTKHLQRRKSQYPETKTSVLTNLGYKRAPEKDQKYYIKK